MTSAPASATTRTFRDPGAGGRGIFAAQIVRGLVRLGSAAALARLLSPEDYGLHGMAAAIFGLLYMARDFGVITALQQPDLSEGRFAALTRIAVCGGIALAAVGCTLAIPAGWFFLEPGRVPPVLALMSVAFVFSGASAPALGILYRDRRATLVAALDVTAVAIASVLAVVAAAFGAGVWSLVLLSVVGEALLCIGAWWTSPRPFHWGNGPIRWRRELAFGARLSAHELANYGARLIDQIIVGRVFGSATLGVYGRGAQVTALPAQFAIAPFGAWVVATLSGLRDSPLDLCRFLQRVLNSLLHVSLAAAAVCIAVPELVLNLLFGPAWLSAANVVRALALVLAVQPLLATIGWLLGALGQSRRLLLWSATGFIATGLACLSVAHRGPGLIALATGCVAIGQAFVAPFYCRAASPVPLSAWFSALRVPSLAHGGLAVALWATDARFSAESPLLRFTVLALVAVVYYGLLLATLPVVRRELREHIFWRR